MITLRSLADFRRALVRPGLVLRVLRNAVSQRVAPEGGVEDDDDADDENDIADHEITAEGEV